MVSEANATFNRGAYLIAAVWLKPKEEVGPFILIDRTFKRMEKKERVMNITKVIKTVLQ